MGCLLVIGASTGGPDAVRAILERLPAEMPGILIVQHLPPRFTESFAASLDESCALAVSEAVDGDLLAPGRALVAPASRHAVVRRSARGFVVALDDGEPVNFQRPSVDVAMRSVAEVAGASAVGVLLTGMGRDGAEGLLEMRRAGARTIAQDEGSSLIFGMPRAAAELGAADTVAPLSEIPQRIIAAITDIASRSQRA
jgi:two-component system chemotaxis response regulator CheB